ncbi:MAG: hypothetical protein ACTSVZ_09425 [Promethearchaeota archaeon]
MLPNMDKSQILADIEAFKALGYPDRNLTKKILTSLGLYDIVDLEFCMNKVPPRERLAAMKMVERYLDKLISGDEHQWADAKDTLKQTYYKVEEMEEEGSL